MIESTKKRYNRSINLLLWKNCFVRKNCFIWKNLFIQASWINFLVWENLFVFVNFLRWNNFSDVTIFDLFQELIFLDIKEIGYSGLVKKKCIITSNTCVLETRPMKWQSFFLNTSTSNALSRWRFARSTAVSIYWQNETIFSIETIFSSETIFSKQ